MNLRSLLHRSAFSLALATTLPSCDISPGRRSEAGCSKDTDCKGDRVCVQGTCTDRSSPSPGKVGGNRPIAARPATCGECSWPGTECVGATCSLKKDAVWIFSPRQVTINAPQSARDPLGGLDFGFRDRGRYDVRVCVRPAGLGDFMCTRDAALGPPDNTRQFVRSSYVDRDTVTLQVGVDSLTRTGIDLQVWVNGTLFAVANAVRHAEGIKASRLLFDGGLSFRMDGTRVHRVTFSLKHMNGE